MKPVETSLFGIRLFATDIGEATQEVMQHALSGAGVVCVANVDMVTRAIDDPKLAAVMQEAKLVVTDGVPLVWALRSRGLGIAKRVYGPDLMRALCLASARAGAPIYLYGGSREELAALVAQLKQANPGLQVAGAESPPMLPQDPPLDLDLVARINASGARMVFVGLGCPKQEYWMANHAAHLNAVAIGVGMAFAQISGAKRAAPKWMSRNGLEWLFRLGQEPRRLWRRYLFGNSKFVWLLLRDFFKRAV